jgi:methylated-DNA-[protein]-cysteine S-methyltransferase
MAPGQGRVPPSPVAADFAARISTPFAVLGLRTRDNALTELSYLPLGVQTQAPSDHVAEQAARELESYLNDPEYRFTVALAPRGTDFQQRVWAALRDIPAGATRSYGQIARIVLSAPRAIGQACGANRIALIIPCHRVVGGQRALGGFMHAATGRPIAIKRWLLTHEGLRPDG